MTNCDGKNKHRQPSFKDTDPSGLSHHCDEICFLLCLKGKLTRCTHANVCYKPWQRHWVLREAADKLISFDNHRFLRWWSWYFPALITLKVSRYLLISLNSCSLKNYSSTSWHPSTSLLKPLSKWAFMDFILKHHILSQITAHRSTTVYNSIKGIRDFTKFSFNFTLLI